MAKKVAIEKARNFDSKTCTKCGNRKKLDEFYINQEHNAGFFRDNWCKECVREYITNLVSLKEYCFYNNREFNLMLYDRSNLEAEQNVLDSDAYLNADIDKRNEIYWNYLRDYYLKKMNLRGNYIYANNDYNVAEIIENTEKQMIDQKINDMLPDIEERAENEAMNAQVIFSDIWNGTYSKRQIEKLERYYARLADNFDITDVHMEDTYREVAKISLERDEALDEYRKTKSAESFKLYKDLCDLYVKMSDTGKLSVSKRTKNDSVGFSDLGSLIKRIEDSGALMRKVEFEKDDVDIVVEDFTHILRSFEGESFEEDAL